MVPWYYSFVVSLYCNVIVVYYYSGNYTVVIIQRAYSISGNYTRAYSNSGNYTKGS